MLLDHLKNAERTEELRKTRNLQYIYQNELEKVCLRLDMAYGDFKDLTRRTASDIILRDEAFNIVNNVFYLSFY